MKMQMTILLAVLTILSGCNVQADQKEWKETGSFAIPEHPTNNDKKATKLTGYEDKLAFIDNGPIVASQPYQTEWFLWGNELTKAHNKSFKLVGIQKLTGKEEKVLIHKHDSKVWSTNNWTPTDVDKQENVRSRLDADASQQVLMSFPSPGLWKVKVYVDDKQYGTIVVDVQERSKDEES